MSLLLSDLVEAARDTTRRHRARTGEAELRADAEEFGRRAIGGRLRSALDAPGVSVIAEVKAASPLRGELRDDFEPLELAAAYRDNGAAAVSVLTEEHFFSGSIDHLMAVSTTIELPTLRKDFIVELYQVFRAATAAATDFFSASVQGHEQPISPMMPLLMPVPSTPVTMSSTIFDVTSSRDISPNSGG